MFRNVNGTPHGGVPRPPNNFYTKYEVGSKWGNNLMCCGYQIIMGGVLSFKFYGE